MSIPSTLIFAAHPPPPAFPLKACLTPLALQARGRRQQHRNQPLLATSGALPLPPSSRAAASYTTSAHSDRSSHTTRNSTSSTSGRRSRAKVHPPITQHAYPNRSRAASSLAPATSTSTPILTTSSPPTTQKTQTVLSPSRQRYLDSALRVNHAGETAAVLIYAGQTPVINRAHPRLRTLMAHMSSQEAGHLHRFNELLARHRVRPTALLPVWRVLAGGLGWATGVMGREAAMACTEAVETEIGEHYNSQVRELSAWADEAERDGESLGPELEELVKDIRRIRDEELEHLDHAVVEDAKEANPYELLTAVIRAGCRGAIWISERV